MRAASIIAMLLFCAQSVLADQVAGVVVFRAGYWSIHRSIDSFTDDVSCVGTYDGDSRIVLKAASLSVNIGGPFLSPFSLRFDNNPPEDINYEVEWARQSGMITLANSLFDRLQISQLLRVRVLWEPLITNNPINDIPVAGF